MPAPASSPLLASASTKAETGRRRREKEIAWGRPVFRPPELINPRVAFDPLPFGTQSFAFHGATGGR